FQGGGYNVTGNALNLTLPSSLTTTGNTVNGSSSITNLPTTGNLFIGMTVTGAGIPNNTTITGITSPTVSAGLSGTTTNGSNSIRAIAPAQIGKLDVGMLVSGTNTPANSFITSISPATISLSATTTNGQLTVTLASTSSLGVGMLVTGPNIQ